MITVIQIVKLISDALQHHDYEVFSAKFAELFYDIEKTGEPDAIKLAYEIESKLADVSAGIASERSFENFLSSKLPLNKIAVPVMLAAFATYYVIPYSVCPTNRFAGGLALASGASGISASMECGLLGLVPQINQTSTAPLH